MIWEPRSNMPGSTLTLIISWWLNNKTKSHIPTLLLVVYTLGVLGILDRVQLRPVPGVAGLSDLAWTCIIESPLWEEACCCFLRWSLEFGWTVWPGTIVSFHKRWVFLCQLFDSFPNLKLKGVAPNSISSNLKKQYKQMINVKGNLIGVVLLLLLPFQIVGRLIFLPQV